MPELPRWTLIDLLQDGQKASPFQHRGPRTYEQQYLLDCNSRKVGPDSACIAPFIPRPYASYVNRETGYIDYYAFCVSIAGERVPNSQTQHIVTCKYSNDLGAGGIPGNFGFPTNDRGQQGKGTENNPELEPPEIEWDFEEVNLPALKDLDGKAYLNSARDPFTPSPTNPAYRSILMITRNELNFNTAVAKFCSGATNDTAFDGYPRDALLCMPPRAKVKFMGGLRYARVTYRIKYGIKFDTLGVRQVGDPEYENFQIQELDQGYNEFIRAIDLGIGNPLDPIESKVYVKKPITFSGQPPKHPQLLDGKGRRQLLLAEVPAGAGGNVGPVDDPRLKPTYIQFRNRRRIDFKELFTIGFNLPKRRNIVTPGGVQPP